MNPKDPRPDGEQPEISRGGSHMLRYPKRTIPTEISHGDGELIDAVSAHFEELFGPIHMVWHEIVSDLVHVDVHHIAPSEKHPYNILFTTGMAEAPMTVPEGVDDRFAEVFIALPPDWPVSQDAFRNEANYWPVRWLKNCARLPHEFDTWLGPGHTYPNGDPPEPFADGTNLCGVMTTPSLLLPKDSDQVGVGARKVRLLYMMPLTAAELRLKLDEGTSVLYDKLDAARIAVPDLACAGRRCAASPHTPPKGKRRWWPFG